MYVYLQLESSCTTIMTEGQNISFCEAGKKIENSQTFYKNLNENFAELLFCSPVLSG